MGQHAMATIGVCLLWFGWFGFTAVPRSRRSGAAVYVLITTMLAASVSCVGAMLTSRSG